MERVPEPELMEEIDQAIAYDEADFDEPNQRFVAQTLALLGQDFAGRLLDLGCGNAAILMELARGLPGAELVGIDGSEAMLERARLRLARDPDIEPRVRLSCERLPTKALAAARFDTVTSNSLLHHLHDPMVLWHTLARCARPGAPVMVADLTRPPSEEAARALQARYADGEPEVLRRDFYNSLRAAFTPDEIRAQLAAAGLEALAVEVISDRHVRISGHVPSPHDDRS